MKIPICRKGLGGGLLYAKIRLTDQLLPTFRLNSVSPSELSAVPVTCPLS